MENFAQRLAGEVSLRMAAAGRVQAKQVTIKVSPHTQQDATYACHYYMGLKLTASSHGSALKVLIVCDPIVLDK